MRYELWASDSGNIVDWFGTEGEALAAVREILADGEAEEVETLILGRVDSEGLPVLVAHGAQLAAYATERASA